MKNKVYDLSRYSFRHDDVVLLDANVWLYLFPAPSSSLSWFASKYSLAVKHILQVKAKLVLDAIVLSEYINRYCRIEWNARYQGQYSEFKKFRCSPDFSSVGKTAAVYTKEILKISQCHDYPFSSLNIDQVLDDFESGANDLNDGLLAHTCRHHGWKLITNDSDFIGGGIEVLTTNPKLLAACSA